jgi:hypothetical protein
VGAVNIAVGMSNRNYGGDHFNTALHSTAARWFPPCKGYTVGISVIKRTMQIDGSSIIFIFLSELLPTVFLHVRHW